MKNASNIENYYTRPDSNQKASIKNAIEIVAKQKGENVQTVEKALNNLNLNIEGVRVLPERERFEISLGPVKVIKPDNRSSDACAIGVDGRTHIRLNPDAVSVVDTSGSKIVHHDLSDEIVNVLSQTGGESLPGYIMVIVPEMVRNEGKRVKAFDVYNLTSGSATYNFIDSLDEKHSLEF